MTDKIYINRMDFFGHHGALPEEKKLGQHFLVDLMIETNLYQAADKDDLRLTINYAVVFEQVQAIVTGPSCDLIETLAQRIAVAVLRAWPAAETCQVKVAKTNPPINGHYKSVAVEIERRRTAAYLGFGSNIGDRAGYLQRALVYLQKGPDVRIIRCSPIYETAPYGPIRQADFLNMAVQIETLLPPEILLERLQQIEQTLQRERKVHWGPRTIDLDILLYNQTIIRTEKLALPHPELSRRAFVLKPLADIAPHLVVPGINRSVIELWDLLEKKEGVRLWRKNNGEGAFGLFAN